MSNQRETSLVKGVVGQTACNPAVKPGDKIQTGHKIVGDDNIHWGTRTVEVRSVDSSGQPYVRYRYGKIKKAPMYWRLPNNDANEPSRTK